MLIASTSASGSAGAFVFVGCNQKFRSYSKQKIGYTPLAVKRDYMNASEVRRAESRVRRKDKTLIFDSSPHITEFPHHTTKTATIP